MARRRLELANGLLTKKQYGPKNNRTKIQTVFTQMGSEAPNPHIQKTDSQYVCLVEITQYLTTGPKVMPKEIETKTTKTDNLMP